VRSTPIALAIFPTYNVFKITMADRSNGYEAVAQAYIAGRGTGGTIGANVVREWAQALPARAHVLDLGCGTGMPISQVLIDRGLVVYGVDASASMIAAFLARFPDSPAE